MLKTKVLKRSMFIKMTQKDDEAFELAQDFAQRYRITNNQKQHDLLNLLKTKIHEH